MLAHALGGPSYSFTVHGPEEFDKPEFIHLAEKISRSRFVVAISSYGRSQLYRWVPNALWPKVAVVHCGLEASFHQGDLPPVPAAPRLVWSVRASKKASCCCCRGAACGAGPRCCVRAGAGG